MLFIRNWLIITCFGYSLRTTYNKHRASISETGQGLLDEGRGDEIAEGSMLWNIWGKPDLVAIEV